MGKIDPTRDCPGLTDSDGIDQEGTPSLRLESFGIGEWFYSRQLAPKTFLPTASMQPIPSTQLKNYPSVCPYCQSNLFNKANIEPTYKYMKDIDMYKSKPKKVIPILQPLQIFSANLVWF